jgi:hypothetical protein
MLSRVWSVAFARDRAFFDKDPKTPHEVSFRSTGIIDDCSLIVRF